MSSGNSGEEHARYLYEVRGDVSSSSNCFKQLLKDFQKEKKVIKNKQDTNDVVLVHNDLLLECLQQSKDCQKSIISQLENIMLQNQPYDDSSVVDENENDKGNKKGLLLSELQYLILSYNLAIITIVTSSDYEKAEQILFPIYLQFEHQMTRVKKKAMEEEQQICNDVRDVQCKIAFLLMDTILEQTKGTASVSTLFLTNLNGILEWIQNYLAETLALNQTRTSTTTTTTGQTKNNNGSTTSCFFNESITELKYRLHLYKTRIKFLREEYQMEEQDDAKTRVARKELKNAMEIYHRKLANPSTTTTTTTKNTNTTTTTTATTTGLNKNNNGGEGSTINSRGGSLDESAAASTYEGSISSNTSNLDNMPTTTTYNQQESTTSQVETTAFKSKRLHGQNQYALYLKANLEHLKGNTKKSLKLCAEALHASERRRESVEEIIANNDHYNHKDDHFYANTNTNNEHKMKTNSMNDNFDKQNSSMRQSFVERCQDKDYAIYYNNLGILHQSSGKVHIAMHYFIKALSCIERLEKQLKILSTTSFELDGTIGIIPKHDILYNTALCANQVPGNKNAKIAYECMAKCIHGSHTFRKRPRCWLRMAESCVGIHSNLKANAVPKGVTSFPNLSVAKESTHGQKTFIISDKKRIMIEQKYCPVKLKDENLSQTLGDHADMAQVSNNPLPRAIYCIQKCLLLCNSSDADNGEREKEIEVGGIDDYIDSAMVLLSYIWLELKEYAPALSAAQLVLSRLAAKSAPNCENDRSIQINEKRRRRKQACARMYVCEAYCAMGNADSATSILMNNNGNDEDLSKGKQRLDELGNDLVLYCTNSNMTAKNLKLPLPAWKKRREKESLASVYTMAAGVSILKGNLNLAKKYAETAVSFTESEKDSSNQNAIKSTSTPTFTSENSLLAKKALLHCLLQNNEHEKALELLQAAQFT